MPPTNFNDPLFDSSGRPTERVTRDEVIKYIQDSLEYGDSAKAILKELQEVVKARPSDVKDSELKSLVSTYAICGAETSDKEHKCTREKGHPKRHKDAKFTWLDGEVAANRASRVSAIQPDGTCKNGHQLLINGEPTKDYSVSKKNEIKCKACNRDYQKRFRAKSQQPIGIIDEAFKKLVEKFGLESFDAGWFEFKAKFKKLDMVQALGKLLELPSLDPEVYDYLVQSNSTSQALTVPVEPPGKVQDEPVQPGKYVDLFPDPEVGQQESSNIF